MSGNVYVRVPLLGSPRCIVWEVGEGIDVVCEVLLDETDEAAEDRMMRTVADKIAETAPKT